MKDCPADRLLERWDVGNTTFILCVNDSGGLEVRHYSPYAHRGHGGWLKCESGGLWCGDCADSMPRPLHVISTHMYYRRYL